MLQMNLFRKQEQTHRLRDLTYSFQEGVGVGGGGGEQVGHGGWSSGLLGSDSSFAHCNGRDGL